jgi:hypothetical protein
MSSGVETCELCIDGRSFSFQVEGEFTWGEDEVLYEPNGVLSRASWKEKGYGTIQVFTPAQKQQLVDGTVRIIKGLFDELDYHCPRDFRLEDYHKVVVTPEMHQEVIKRTRFLTNKDFPLSTVDIAQRVSSAIGRSLSVYNPVLNRVRRAREGVVILRISRPQSLDINPPHRDGYLDVWKHTLNCWIPVAGCDRNSSLPLIPGSHLSNEKDIFRTAAESARFNGLAYTVPAIVKIKRGMFMTRPEVRLGELLAFTPFMIHGSALNLNPETTRVSFELRLFDEAGFVPS